MPLLHLQSLGLQYAKFLLPLNYFSHYGGDVLSTNLQQSACHLKVTLRTSRFSAEFWH